MAGNSRSNHAGFAGVAAVMAQHGTLLISGQALRSNILRLRQRVRGNTLQCAVLKANAYGHGMAALLPLLRDIGIHWACVYSLAEAVQAAALGWDRPVLVLSTLVARQERVDFDAAEWKLLCGGQVRLTLTDAASAQALASAIRNAHLSVRVPVHVQVDTGLTRQGAELGDVGGLCEQILSLPQLKLDGMYMHMSHGDEPGSPATAAQLAVFREVAWPVKRRHSHVLLHAQNSGGTWHEGDIGLDMVRLGIAMYGLQPSLHSSISDFKPVAKLVAPIIAVHARPAGTGVGYGHSFRTNRPSRLAVVPVGYADGYPRELSGRATVGVLGREVPVVGRVSMDQTIVDITDVAAALGDEVTLISDDSTASYSMDRLAEKCRTIGYELATRLGQRLNRVVKM